MRLAKALGCSIDDLLRPDANLSPPKFAFRAHSALKKDPSVLVKARKFLNAYAEIEQITEARLSDRLHPFICDSDGPLNDREIEGIADDLRQNCGLHDSGPENIASVLESLGVRCLFFDFDSLWARWYYCHPGRDDAHDAEEPKEECGTHYLQRSP